MPESEQQKKALIVVRTYPTPAKTGVEISCTAAITDGGEWLRLFPIPYRFLPQDQRFRKYQWIDVTTTKASKDPRPESYKIKIDSIQINSEPLPTKNEWAARKAIIAPLKSHCLCCLEKNRKANGHPTLGIFRPYRIEKFLISGDRPTWTIAQLAVLRQGHLFESKKIEELEKIPHKFQYKFFCNHSSCNGHTLMCHCINIRIDGLLSASFILRIQRRAQGSSTKLHRSCKSCRDKLSHAFVKLRDCSSRRPRAGCRGFRIW
jgi:hypothetical protein